VCLGNICRSPIGHVVLERKLRAVPTRRRIQVESSGTGDWHVGEPMDRRAAATLAAAGYDPSLHRARQADRAGLARNDLILVMDAANFRDVQTLVAMADDRERDRDRDRDQDRVMLFRAFDPMVGEDLDVPDPWYGGQRGFDDVLEIVERTTDALVDALASV
jgi:protein-tyrosine phosphatase